MDRAYRLRLDAESASSLPEAVASIAIIIFGLIALWDVPPLHIIVASSMSVVASAAIVTYLLRRGVPRRRVAILRSREQLSFLQVMAFASALFCGIQVAALPQLSLSVRIVAPIAIVALTSLAWLTLRGNAVLVGDDLEAAVIVDRRLRISRAQGLLFGSLAVAVVAAFFGSIDVDGALGQSSVWTITRGFIPALCLIYYLPQVKPANVELSGLE